MTLNELYRAAKTALEPVTEDPTFEAACLLEHFCGANRTELLLHGDKPAEAVRGLVDRLHPSAVIAVDALASRRVGRVCCTVQFSDTGIIPGSGVGNHRSALNRETLGVPVLAVGVPTVVDAATLAADLLEESGLPEPDMEMLRSRPENLMVTPRDIDQQVRDLGKVIGYGINWALQDLEIEEINALLS